MSTVLGSLRRLVLAPSLADVTFGERGFQVEPTEATQRLEAIPQSVVCGFEWGIDARDQWEIVSRLDLVDPELRGFAYEGATMAFTILDVLPGRNTGRTRELLRGPGEPHIFLAYIGIGFAMARLPRPLWKKVLPDLSGSAYYPTMSWLAVDGYGFDRAYFDTRRWVDRQERPAAYPWQDSAGYFPRAVDQGIGRALWFIAGGRVTDAAAAVRRFAVSRHSDLWSGVGLAAAFAGGCGPEDLAALRREAGTHWPELAQGVVFAVRARTYSGYLPPHTAATAEILTDLSVESAVALADSTEVEFAASDRVPAYERWRWNIQAHFASSGRSLTARGGGA